MCVDISFVGEWTCVSMTHFIPGLISKRRAVDSLKLYHQLKKKGMLATDGIELFLFYWHQIKE